MQVRGCFCAFLFLSFYFSLFSVQTAINQMMCWQHSINICSIEGCWHLHTLSGPLLLSSHSSKLSCSQGMVAFFFSILQTFLCGPRSYRSSSSICGRPWAGGGRAFGGCRERRPCLPTWWGRPQAEEGVAGPECSPEQMVLQLPPAVPPRPPCARSWKRTLLLPAVAAFRGGHRQRDPASPRSCHVTLAATRSVVSGKSELWWSISAALGRKLLGPGFLPGCLLSLFFSHSLFLAPLTHTGEYNFSCPLLLAIFCVFLLHLVVVIFLWKGEDDLLN